MTRTSTTSKNESFSIRVLSVPSPTENDRGGDAVGRVTVGEFEERFPMSLTYWGARQYEGSWARSMRVLVEGADDARSCLVSSITDPVNSNFVFCWPLYRSGSTVYVQNSIIFLDELEEEFSPDEPWRFVEARSTVDEDGQEISEWQTTIAAVREALRTMCP